MEKYWKNNNRTGGNKRTWWKKAGKNIKNNGPVGVIFCILNNIFHFLMVNITFRSENIAQSTL